MLPGFAAGGWLYIDIVNAEYKAVQAASLEDADGPFVKRYAARIPPLKSGPNGLCSLLFFSPFYYRKTTDTVDPEPKGEWTRSSPKRSEYNDGFRQNRSCGSAGKWQPSGRAPGRLSPRQ